MSSKNGIADAAREILQARTEGIRLGTFSQMYPGISLEQAYAVQYETVRQAAQARVFAAGYKVAYTSAATRGRCGVSELCFGHILSDRIIPSGDGFPIPAHGVLKAEPEVVFVMGEDLSGPRVSIGNAMLAVAGWMPGFELVDPCFSSERPDLAGEVAENMSFGALVIGSSLQPIVGTDWENTTVRFFRNEEPVSQAPSSVVMDGSPLYSVVWLANSLAEDGLCLKKGDLVLSGSPVAPIRLQRGDRIRAEFETVCAGMRCHCVSTYIK